MLCYIFSTRMWLHLSAAFLFHKRYSETEYIFANYVVPALIWTPILHTSKLKLHVMQDTISQKTEAVSN